MDLKYGSEARDAFVTNVGLITSRGLHDDNIMAAEWTFQVSYDPPLFAISLGPTKATTENIRDTKVFGVSIASESQNMLASVAGGSTGKDVKKIGALEEMGYTFRKSSDLDLYLVDGAMLTCECSVIDERVYGDHVVFIGEARNIEANTSLKPLVYHRGKYVTAGEDVPKPGDVDRERMGRVVEKYQKKS